MISQVFKHFEAFDSFENLKKRKSSKICNTREDSSPSYVTSGINIQTLNYFNCLYQFRHFVKLKGKIDRVTISEGSSYLLKYRGLQIFMYNCRIVRNDTTKEAIFSNHCQVDQVNTFLLV